MHGVEAILNGRLNLRQMKRIKEMLANFDLQYTVHCSDWLNLMTAEELALHRNIFEASIDFRRRDRCRDPGLPQRTGRAGE